MDNIAHAWMHRHLKDPAEACQAFTALHEATKYDLIRESCGMITLCSLAGIDIHYQPLEIEEHVPSLSQEELSSAGNDTSEDEKDGDDNGEGGGDDGNGGDSKSSTNSSHSSGSSNNDPARQQLDFDANNDTTGDEDTNDFGSIDFKPGAQAAL